MTVKEKKPNFDMTVKVKTVTVKQLCGVDMTAKASNIQ